VWRRLWVCIASEALIYKRVGWAADEAASVLVGMLAPRTRLSGGTQDAYLCNNFLSFWQNFYHFLVRLFYLLE
jgi:hypothetical protein